mgnify:CR=1 FL=1
MRIQHNIMAMNAYRNYTANTSAVAKNLEKLSSGYKINRAGDDAAGLAISEKMRAQITGLSAAQKNVKDGISLVKTAEGATQEIHDMLNRMVYLAEQSANGTYQDKVDRDAIQDEYTALKTEIDRIADSSNFNGIKLLDGSLAGNNGKGSASVGTITAGTANALTAANGAAFTQDVTVQAGAANKEVSLELKYLDKDGNLKNATVSAKLGTDAAPKDVGAALKGELEKVFGTGYTVTADTASGKITIANKNKEDDQTRIITAVQKNDGKETTTAPTVGNVTAGKADKFAADLTGMTVAADKVNGLKIDGTTYQIVTRGGTVESGSRALYIDQTSGTINADSAAQIVKQLQAYGVNAEVDGTTATTINISKGDASGGKGLTLQIGDDSEPYNQLTVSVSDMHADALGIDQLDLNSQSGAQAAVATIKDAINKVSTTRGKLGATQNRLEHTSNNLSVMKENIQDAEAAIRDTDIAEEMMAYTKNNILVQSAQAMLAQANQVPQGVLQLLG